MDNQTFQIGNAETTARDVQAIIEHLVKENPNMTKHKVVFI